MVLRIWSMSSLCEPDKCYKWVDTYATHVHDGLPNIEEYVSQQHRRGQSQIDEQWVCVLAFVAFTCQWEPREITKWPENQDHCIKRSLWMRIRVFEGCHVQETSACLIAFTGENTHIWKIWESHWTAGRTASRVHQNTERSATATTRAVDHVMSQYPISHQTPATHTIRLSVEYHTFTSCHNADPRNMPFIWRPQARTIQLTHKQVFHFHSSCFRWKEQARYSFY